MRASPDPTPSADPGRPRRAVLIVSALLAVLLAACDPPDEGTDAATSDGDGMRVEARVDGEPVVGAATVVVTVHEGDAPVTDAEVEVTGDMTHAGMTPVVATAPHESDGTYRTEGFEFTMAGDWILTVDAVAPDGSEAGTTLELTVPGE